MFDDFLRNCPMYDEIKPSKKRVKKNFAALKSLIETEGSSMPKHILRLKPLVVAAVIIIISAVSLLMVVNAAPQEVIVNFTMGGEEFEGKYYDYVDNGGVRHIYFTADGLPMDEPDIALVYDIDAPQGENVRVLTDDTDPDFFENVRSYIAADKKAWEEADKEVTVTEDGVTVYTCDVYTIDPEEFGLVFKDNEYCDVHLEYDETNRHEQFGGLFIDKCEDEGKPANSNDPDHPGGLRYDLENETYSILNSFCYYVGKE